MADTEVDVLQIRVDVDTKSAESGIERLKKSIGELSSAFSGSTNASSKAKAIKTISDAAKELDYSSTVKLKGLAEGLNALSNVGKISIPKSVADGITNLGTAVATLADVDMSKLSELASGLGMLSGIGNVKTPKITGGKGSKKSPGESIADEIVDEQKKVAESAVTESEKTAESWSNASDQVSSAFSKLRDSFSKGFYGVGKNDTPWQDMQWADRLASGSEKMGAAMASGAGVGESAMAGLAALGPEVMVAVTAVETLGRAISTVWGIAKPVISGTLRSVAKIELAIAKIGTTILSLPIKWVSNTVNSLVEKLRKGIAALTRVAIYRFIRAAIKEITQGFSEGIKNLYQYSALFGGTFAKSMDKLATSALYLKNSLGAMAAPLINVLAPAIDYIVDKFVDLLNVINQVFAALTGASTWTKAIKYPYSYAEAANLATKANKELKKSLLSIDEINRLTDNSNGKGGGSGSALDYSSMFEEQNVESTIAKFFANLKEAFENGDYDGVGRIFGEGVNSAFQKINEYIKWDNVGVKVIAKLNSVLTMLNSAGNAINWNLIGETFASGFNTAVSSLAYVVQNVDLSGAARNLTTAINSFVGKVDWTLVGDTISAFFLNTMNAMYTAVRNFDWENLGTKLAEMFSRIDTTDIVNTVTDTIFSLFNGAFSAVDSFIDGGGFNFQLSDIVAHLTDKIAEQDWNQLGKKLAKVFDSLGVGEAASSLIDLFFGIVSAGIDTIAGFAESAEGKKQIESAITKLLTGIANFFKTDWPKVKGIFKSALKTVATNITSLLWDSLKEKIKEKGFGGVFLEAISAMNDIRVLAISPLTLVIKKIVEGSFKQLGEDITSGKLTATLTSFWNSIVIGLSNAVLAFTHSQTLANAVLKLLAPVPEKAEEVGKKAGSDLTSGITNKLDDSGSQSNITKSVVGLFKNSVVPVTDAGTGLGGDLVSGLSTGINNDNSKITTALKTTINKFDAKGTGKTLGEEIVDGIATGMKNKKLPKIEYSFNFTAATGNNPKLTATPEFYAAGGYPATGELYIAREAGPELVGSIGNHTAVANNDQIVDAVSQGVYEANTEQNALLREQNELLRAILSNSGGEPMTADAILSVLGRYNRRVGQPVVAMT